MELLFDTWTFITTGGNWSSSTGIVVRAEEHIIYTVITVAIAILIAIPIGVIIGHTGKGAFMAINSSNTIRSLPTLGLLTSLVLLMGLGLFPVIIALVVLAIPPILTSTYAAIQSVPRSIVDAARCVGMTEPQILLQIEIPNALPLIVGGIRSSVLQVISTAIIAAYVASGGLGRLLLDGLALRDYPQMTAGALLVAALALLANLALTFLQKASTPKGLRRSDDSV